MSEHIILFSTTNSIEDAKRIATHLIDNRLAACVNIVPGITSIYRWENKVTEDQEFLMVIKTTADRVKDVEQAVQSLHNYETPELIGFPLTYGLPRYLQWLDISTATEEP